MAAGRPPVRRLDPDTINQIAAGEVVERPASVVKELVENSLDAGASRIHVEVRGGGIQSIRVVDDGWGMGPDDAGLALERHATSKLRSAADLATVATLGFRGEALPSIAAVARLTLVTRPPEAVEGTEIRAEGGRITRRAAPSPPGTSVTVTDLFYNTPARRKHLRPAAAEAAAITHAVTALALAHPRVAFSLVHDGREVLRTPGSGQLAATVAAVWDPGAARRMVPVDGGLGKIRVTGLVARPETARASRARQHFTVNARPVESTAVAAGLERAYRTLLPPGRFPAAVLHLMVPEGTVDVNVHPAKREVRFVDPAAVSRAVELAVTEGLSRAGAGPLLAPGAPPAAGSRPEPRTEPGVQVADAGALYAPWDAPGPGRDDPAAGAVMIPEAQRAPVTEGAAQVDFERLEPLGQVLDSYIVARGPDGLYLVDQHAAAERLVYEAALDLKPGGPVSQALLVPVALELDPEAFARWESVRGDLEELGFAFEPFGAGRELLVRAVPYVLGETADTALVSDVLDLALRGPAEPDPLARREEFGRVLASCKAALKANQALSREEMADLLRAMGRARQPYYCLHGRPTVLRLGRRELERRFGRG